MKDTIAIKSISDLINKNGVAHSASKPPVKIHIFPVLISLMKTPIAIMIKPTSKQAVE